MIENVKHHAAGLLSRASGHAPTLHTRPLAVNICTHPPFLLYTFTSELSTGDSSRLAHRMGYLPQYFPISWKPNRLSHFSVKRSPPMDNPPTMSSSSATISLCRSWVR